MIRAKSHCMCQTQVFHSVISEFINLASRSSVVSICLLNLSRSLLFLSLSSLVSTGRHVSPRVLALRVCTVFLHLTPVYTPKCRLSVFLIVNFRARDARTTLVS